MADRDDSMERTDAEKLAQEEAARLARLERLRLRNEDKRKMVPNVADIAMRKRVMICKAARRLERYNHVGDAQDLVRLVGDIAGSVEGKPVDVECVRHQGG